MKIVITAILFCSIGLLAFAHPGVGIVKDKKGNIYYSTLKQVWKISADGKRKIVVPNIHMHESYMASADNLFGEHLWYNGEQLNTWGHYVWSLKSDGSIVKVIGPKEGFLENYSFVRDNAGNMYWVERWKVSRIKKKSRDGNISIIAEGSWGDVRWMFATPKGKVYFTSRQKLTPTGGVFDNAGNLWVLENSGTNEVRVRKIEKK